MEENKTLSELKNTKGMVVGHDRIERFQAAFRGEVIQPGDSTHALPADANLFGRGLPAR
jgi:hypothetical protein